MRVKRGKDRWWRMIRYKGDLAIYAKCKCGFIYNCSTFNTNEYKTKINLLYHYCPQCGAYKKWYENEPKMIDNFPWQ